MPTKYVVISIFCQKEKAELAMKPWMRMDIVCVSGGSGKTKENVIQSRHGSTQNSNSGWKPSLDAPHIVSVNSVKSGEKKAQEDTRTWIVQHTHRLLAP
jgi:hypothetical protein